MAFDPLSLYEAQYRAKSFERRKLFELLADHFRIRSALYPGSYVHVTPSFFVPTVVYVDSDRRASRFFTDPRVREFVESSKRYPDNTTIRFHHADYTEGFDEEPAAFDLLISQWAGFVSVSSGRYPRLGGYLLANDSHGDAGVAFLDPGFELVGVIQSRGETYRLKEDDLSEYFVPKPGREASREDLLALGRGIGYMKTAWSYLFKKRRER